MDKESDEEGSKALKGGQVRMNPAIYNILHNKPPVGLELIRRDEIFKSIQYHLNPCYIVSEVDPN